MIRTFETLKTYRETYQDSRDFPQRPEHFPKTSQKIDFIKIPQTSMISFFRNSSKRNARVHTRHGFEDVSRHPLRCLTPFLASNFRATRRIFRSRRRAAGTASQLTWNLSWRFNCTWAGAATASVAASACHGSRTADYRRTAFQSRPFASQ